MFVRRRLRLRLPFNDARFLGSDAAAEPCSLLSCASPPLILRLSASSAQSLARAKQTHALASVLGLLSLDPLTCASLMLSYASFSDTHSSRLLFEHHPAKHRNAFLSNTLIRAYNTAGISNEAFMVYNRIFRDGVVRPDDHTFPFVLKACADSEASQKGREIHGSILKLGFDGDVFVGNTLMAFYGSSVGLCDAVRVFDEMPERDVISWNSMIMVFSSNGCLLEAVDKFIKLKLTSGLVPNSVSLVSVLPVCAALEDEVTVKWVHSYVVKAGLDLQVTVCNAFVDAYGKCGNPDASSNFFVEMPERNEVSWNTMIGSFSHSSRFKDALDTFKAMLDRELKPNSVTLSHLLPALVELKFFNMGKEVHGYSVRRSAESDIFVANSLIDMYAKSGCPKEASNMFYKMESRNVVSWNAMIANFAQNGLELEAMKLVNEMQVHGESPNSVTFTNVLPACARVASLRQGKEIHAQVIRMGTTFDSFVANALSDMYVKCGRLNFARNVFNNSMRDEVSYNILTVGYSQSWHCAESLQLFREMGLMGLKYDTVSFVGVLSACANMSAIKQGTEIHGLLVRKLLHSHLFIANSLLDLYTKCGRIDLARQIFDRISDKDVASWNTMILGYGMQGELQVAISLFDMMEDEGVEYDHVSYIAVLSACSHGGLVERGRRYFKQMCGQDIRPTQMHYACMVDLLGRAGLMEEAAEFIRGLPIEPDSNVWGAMLGACRMHGSIELARWAAEHLFELKPEHSGYYVLLSNMYAELGMWDDANKVRKLMKSRGVKKNPGCSWIKIHDQMHAFVVGERIEGPEEVSCDVQTG
ncbi:hypothetical protein AAC387_Pa02g4602 [Persea americana]